MLALLLAALGYGTPDCIGNPPARYRGNATVIVHFVSRAGIARACLDDEAIACSLGNEIWARNPCRAKEAGDLSSLASDLCHELGHVNGWPDDHPKN